MGGPGGVGWVLRNKIRVYVALQAHAMAPLPVAGVRAGGWVHWPRGTSCTYPKGPGAAEGG